MPRLLYVGDIAVEEGVGGCAQLYRLLQNYPPSRLRVVEGNLWPSRPERRLPDVDYHELKVGHERLMRSRITPLYTAYLHATSSTRLNELVRLAENFGAEAILTVAHGFSWETAAAVADRCSLPLHLIVHDDWATLSPVPEVLRGWLHRRFGEVYRRAQARFCISPYMAEEYESRYGAEGAVLYPLRERQQFTSAARTDQSGRLESPVFAFIGAIHGGYEKPLRLLAGVLEEFNGQLVIYSELNEAAIENLGLSRKNVTIKPHMPMGRLSQVLREEADVLFVSMSFIDAHSPNMKLCFPSKLTDYTAIGLPILICGPRYCCAVRWARQNPGVAEVVDEQNLSILRTAVNKLVTDSAQRLHLAENALATGAKYFSHSAVTQQFYQAIS